MEPLEEVLNNIKKGLIAPCYLLYGEEEFLLQESLNKIIDLVLPPADRDLNLFFIDGEQENTDEICLALLTVPLIPGRKIVAVKNTALFQSKKVLPKLLPKIRDRLESSPSQAASDFLQFLRLAGWKIADLRDGGWKRITDEEWQKTLDGERDDDRETWLPKIIDLCVELGLEATPKKDDLSGLSRVLAGGIPEGNHLILTAQAVDKRKQLFKQIAETGKVLYFPHPKGETQQKTVLHDMARKLLAEKGKRVTPDAWESLGKKTGFDLRGSMLALDKLITYAGDRPTISAGDVEAVIGKTKDDTVFDLTSALGEKNLQQSLVILKDLLEQGVHHLVITKMITREVRLLLLAKLLTLSGTVASSSKNMEFSRFQTTVYPALKKEKGGELLAGQHPYVIYKLLRSSERFTYDALVQYLEYLAEMDLSLRSTGRDPRLMLERFLVEVCTGC